jgi:hypothetical protein
MSFLLDVLLKAGPLGLFAIVLAMVVLKGRISIQYPHPRARRSDTRTIEKRELKKTKR